MIFTITNRKEEFIVDVTIDGNPLKIEGRNHFDIIRQLLSKSDEVFLVSPFLYQDFESFFQGLSIDKIKIELITTCAPRGTEQLKKPFSLKSFGEQAAKHSGEWPSIGIDQALHSKIYVFYKNNKAFAGIVTSANLTDSGLKNNHETGIILFDSVLLQQIRNETKLHLDYVNLSAFQIGQLCTAASIMAREIKPQVDHEIGLNNILNNFCTPSEGNRNITLRDSTEYYIKVSGVTDEPILPENKEPFDEPHSQLSFAKSPNNIKLGDCLLEVAVGGRCFLSYYSCASSVFERTEEEKRNDPNHKRWPYFVYANNLSLHYGKKWFDDPLYYNELVERFKTAHPDTPVTMAGKDHFVGAIQLGHSYVHVTKEFGEFVRKEIDSFKS